MYKFLVVSTCLTMICGCAQDGPIEVYVYCQQMSHDARSANQSCVTISNNGNPTDTPTVTPTVTATVPISALPGGGGIPLPLRGANIAPGKEAPENLVGVILR